MTLDIIEKQISIKETAEKLKSENEQLQLKSRELQTILATSQKQLQLETSIPILMINKLVEEVNHIKVKERALGMTKETPKPVGQLQCRMEPMAPRRLEAKVAIATAEADMVRRLRQRQVRAWRSCHG